MSIARIRRKRWWEQKVWGERCGEHNERVEEEVMSTKNTRVKR